MNPKVKSEEHEVILYGVTIQITPELHELLDHEKRRLRAEGQRVTISHLISKAIERVYGRDARPRT